MGEAMNFSDKLKFTVTTLFLTLSGTAIAQDAQDDQADVWATIEGQWVAEEKGDEEWMMNLLVPEFSGWGKNSPAPRSKSSTIMWDRFSDEQGEMVAHELYPLAIVVDGDVAIAHYLYTSASENKDDDVETSNGRYTDILVRRDDGWKFIAWHGGDDE
jgi:ketosteroid isomerase-like protein